MKLTVKVTGLKELQQNLESLKKLSQQRAVMRKAIDEAAEPMLEDAKSNGAKIAPWYGESFEQGGKLNKNQARIARKNGKDKNAVYRYVGSTSDLSTPIEHGTRRRLNSPDSKFPGTIHPGTTGNKGMTQAFESNKQVYVDRLAAALRKHIDKAIKNQSRREARAAAKAQKG